MAFQGDSIFWVEVEKIVPNPYQPRREFDESRLKELSESVRMYGILQPLTVTRKEVANADGSFRSEYELIAGERRLRASKLAGLAQVPVIIRDGEQSEQEKLELAIIENLQREDLNAVDRALAFRQLADVFGLSHVQVAAKVGRSREYVSNSIRLLALPDYMLSSLRLGDMSEGHARTLLMLNDRPEEQDTVFREILLKKLSVREVERIARNIATEKVRRKDTIDTELIELERKFTETLGTRVSIVKTDFGGKLTIDYFSQDDLETMLLRMREEHTKVSLPKEGTMREVMELQEDKETKQALESLTESTGLAVVPEIELPVAVSVIEVVSTVSPALVPPVPVIPVTPAVVVLEKSVESNPTPHASSELASGDSSLRSQLASLLGQVVPKPTIVASTVAPVLPTVAIVPPKPPQPVVTPSAPRPGDSDDSDLYSINSFTI